MSKTNRYKNLTSQLKSKVQGEENEEESKLGKGKRSNPEYMQTGIYVKKDLHKTVKKLLFDKDIDFSDLVNSLLDEWSNNQ